MPSLLSSALIFLLLTILLPLSMLLIASVLPRASRLRTQLQFLARMFVSLVALCACALYGSVASVVLRLVGYGGLGQWTTARAFKWTMRLGVDVGFEIVEGKEYLSSGGNGWRAPGEARVFVGNHQTELDVLMLGAVFPPYTSVTAKSSLRWFPFLGWFMTLSQTIFIERRNRTSALAAFDNAAATMRQTRQSVFIFPEGTRSYAATPMLLPFKKGAFHLAVQAQVPIVPVVVANYAHVLDLKKRSFNAGTIPVKILPPVETNGLTADDVEDLAREVRERMLTELEDLSEKARRETPANVAATANGGPTAPARRPNGGDAWGSVKMGIS